MAENQTAAEDSGQQSTQHQTHPHHSQQQQQQHPHNDNSQPLSTQNSEEISSALASPTTPPNENNSASSPDEPQTIVIANHHQQQQINQAQQQTQQQQVRSMIDRQVTTKIKAIRRNTIQTTTVPIRATSTTSIKKTSLTKMNSLTGSPGNGEKNTTTTTITTTEKHHLQQQQQQHHHHHHQHNSMTNHHHHHHHNHQNNSSPTTGNNSNSTAIHRTTSESLRLNAMPPSSGGTAAGGGGGGGDILSNATSNSSIHSNLTNNSSSSASVAPKSTSTNASHSKSTTSKSSSASSKATSPNNNNSIASVTAGSSQASRSHHSHGHIPGHGHGHVAGSVRKPKTTSSFQITSVTVGHAKAPVSASDNGEEESADDLDESHTDDNSRITDLENETPSMSEDTFSKEEIYYHQDDALSSTAPVIPTSSQYGLVVTTLGAQDISNVQVNVGENFINVVPSGSGMKKEDLKDSAQHRSERFKVVKIESTEPFRRGRWVCMDYLDHTSVSGKEDGGSGAAGNNNEKTETGGAVDNGEHAPKTTQSMILGPGAAAAMENHIEPNSAPTADGNWNFPDTSGNLGGGGTSTAPATVMHGIQQFVETAEGVDHQSQIMQQEPQYQTPPQEVNANSTPQMTMTAQAPPDVVPMDYATVAAQKLKKSLEELKKQEEAIAASEKAAAAVGGVYMPGQSQPVNFEAMQQQQQVPIQQTQQVALQQQQHQQQQQHASTLPGNINMQNGNISIATDNKNVVQPSQQQAHSLGYNVETQQPMSPAPQQIQVPPNFVTSSFQGTPQQTPPQQSPQMQEAGQTMQQQPQQPQQQMNTQQMQQAPQQQPAPTQLQQQTSQTDGVTNVQNTASLNNMQQMQQQQQPHAQAVQQQLPPQFQHLQQQQPLVPGQTMPILTQMTSYDMQQQQHQQQQHQLQHQQSAPATMLDNSALLASLQQQQQQQQQQPQQSSTTNTMPGATNIIMQPATGSAPSQYQQHQKQQQQTQLPIDSAPPTSVSANSSNSTVNLNPISTATMIPINSSNVPLTATNVANSNNNNNNNTTPNIDNQTIMQQQQQMQPPQQQHQQQQQTQQPSTSSQLHTTQHQFQQNTETETERNVSSLTHAMSTNNQMNQVNNRKRAFSTPYITAYDQQMLINSSAGSEPPQFWVMPSSMGGNNEQNIYFYNKSSSGRSSFCVDESMWPTGQVSRFINNNPPLMQQMGSDSNIYTSLALGNERYKLPVEFTTSVSPSVSITTKRGTENDDDIDDLVNENEEDLEESADQFSPLLYPATQQRSQPIAISAGNSPVHKPKSAISKHLTSGQKSPKRHPSPTAGNQRQQMAFSASPTGGVFPYSPFYSGSPETTQSNTTPQKVSFSYDPSFGANIYHLPLPQGQQQQQQGQPQQQPKQLPRQPPLPQQRHSQPSSGSQLNSPIQTTQRFSTGSIESAPGAILFASSPTSSLTNSASGTSAVAIDNKIEQAMDLVKSHLMIAVREEVEVLKEKISELVDKINQLELENTVLKAHIPQEALQQLQMQAQLPNAGPAPIAAAPAPAAIAAAPAPAAIAAAPAAIAAAPAPAPIAVAPAPAAIAAAPTTVAPTPAVSNTVASTAANASSSSSTAAATPQSNVGSGTATPTTQQPAAAGTVEQNVEASQIINAATTDDSQGSVQAANAPNS